MRAAIYARYSSSRQLERSIEDQIALCRDFVAAQGWTVVRTFTDHAISGGAMANRPGLIELLTNARAGGFDLVVAEALDRLSRDQEDVAGLFKRLQHAGIEIVTASEGEISEIEIGFKGTMNALFSKDLGDKVRRGQRGRVTAARVPGGLSYGYQVVRSLRPDGELERGLRGIDNDQADIVRRIFAEYVSGKSPRAIAHDLNRDGVPSPRGGTWTASTINGNRARRSGILWNEAYLGRVVWNRIRMVKDPDTGRRLSRPNTPDKVVSVEAPNLRIIDDDIWAKAQALKARVGEYRRPRRRPKRLLSGLVRCGACGGGYTVKDRNRLACSAHREKGTCDNGATVLIDDLERRVLEGLRERLLAPDVVKEYLREYRKGAKMRKTEAAKRTATMRQRLADLNDQIERFVDAIGAGTDTPAVRERLAALEEEKRKIEAEFETAPEARVVDLHPGLADDYRRRVEGLQSALNADDDSRREAGAILRSLIDRIEIVPGERRGKHEAHLHGRLAAVIGLAEGKAPSQPDLGVWMVAGEGLEPPTRGL